jgi:malate permease and related proteins
MNQHFLFTREQQKVLSTYIIFIALPATILFYLPKIKLDIVLLLPLSLGLIGFFLSVIFFESLAWFLKLNHSTKSCLVICCGFGNTSFLGFPIVESVYGSEGLKIAIVADQSTFFCVSSLGVIAGALYQSAQFNLRNLSSRLFTFPPFIALCSCVLLWILGMEFSPVLLALLERISITLSPLALFYIGLQITLRYQDFDLQAVFLGLSYKLLVLPLFYYALAFFIFRDYSLIAKVTVFESGMAPMITASIIAIENDLNPTLANQLVSGGILLSSLSLFIWWFLL